MFMLELVGYEVKGATVSCRDTSRTWFLEEKRTTAQVLPQSTCRLWEWAVWSSPTILWTRRWWCGVGAIGDPVLTVNACVCVCVWQWWRLRTATPASTTAVRPCSSACTGRCRRWSASTPTTSPATPTPTPASVYQSVPLASQSLSLSLSLSLFIIAIRHHLCFETRAKSRWLGDRRWRALCSKSCFT